MVERARFENEYRGNSIAGSNPAASALRQVFNPEGSGPMGSGLRWAGNQAPFLT